MREPAPEPEAVPAAPRVQVLAGGDEVAAAALAELRSTLARQPRALVSFATGATFARFFAALTDLVRRGDLSLEGMLATHLDEYLGFGPDQPGGMVHELRSACPPLDELYAQGRLWTVPASGDAEAMRAHERKLERAGGVALQFLGIGRNGHIAFNEPGTPAELGMHRARLAEVTRRGARARFAGEPPAEAVTAGPRTILAARRVVLAAVGEAKAEAVRAMLRDPISPDCPATLVRRHPSALVLLDRGAARLLGESGG